MQEKRNRPVHGDIWKHFKGNLYEILECPVIHTETREEYVVYRALYGDYGVFAGHSICSCPKWIMRNIPTQSRNGVLKNIRMADREKTRYYPADCCAG